MSIPAVSNVTIPSTSCYNCNDNSFVTSQPSNNSNTTTIPDNSESTKSDSYHKSENNSELAISDNQKKPKNGAEKEELTEEEKQAVIELKTRDQEVRTHEMAHVSAGGQYVRGGASLEYQTGPDGKKYAVGGEVSIDTSEISDDPQATINKMQVIKRAALAPASPSAQDRSIAAMASQKEIKARQKLVKEKNEGVENGEGVKNTEIDGNKGNVKNKENNEKEIKPESPQKTVSYSATGNSISSDTSDQSLLLDIFA